MKKLKYFLLIALTAIFLLTSFPTIAAEKIYFNVSFLRFSLRINDLVTYVKEGKITTHLAFYLNRLNPQQQSQLLELLQRRYKVTPVTLSRFAHTTAGEHFLKTLGEVIQIPRQQNGGHGIRSALIESAKNPDGITLLDMLRNFPTDIELNTKKIIALTNQASNLIKQTKTLVTQLKEKNTAIAKSETFIDYTQLPDLRRPGNFNVTQQNFKFFDSARQRRLIFDLYLPENYPDSIPIVFISNGIGATRDRFEYLAKHLASYGIAVASLDHPGSDRRYQAEFFEGLYDNNFESKEFINRPLDITYILDQLTLLNDSNFSGKLNLQQAGVFGYSFGGTTALSLAGAQIDQVQLTKTCNSEINLLNISVFYQCRALEYPESSGNFKDDRIKAIFLFVPFSSLFSQASLKNITIPILWQATDDDVITPLLLQQMPSFNSLANPDTYLAVSQGLPHSPITITADKSDSVAQVRKVLTDYHNALSVAFFKSYLAQDNNYLPYLRSAYAETLTQGTYSITLLKNPN